MINLWTERASDRVIRFAKITRHGAVTATSAGLSDVAYERHLNFSDTQNSLRVTHHVTLNVILYAFYELKGSTLTFP